MNTDETTRIEFAERQGWTRNKELDFKIGFDDEYQKVWSRGDRSSKECDLPDPTDHNHVHAALMGMSEEEWRMLVPLIMTANKLFGAEAWASVFHTLKTPLSTLVECFLKATKGRSL